MEKEKIVLAPDVYDTIEFAALVFRGIGGGAYALGPKTEDYERDTYYGNEKQVLAPMCAVGFAAFVGLEDSDSVLGHCTVQKNDDAVARINKRKGRKNKYARVPFRDWCEETGVVRGEEGEEEQEYYPFLG